MSIIESVLVFFVILYVSFSLVKKIKGTREIKLRVFFVLFTMIHFSISIVFGYYLETFSNINDPKDFYEIASSANSWVEIFGIGHNFIGFVIYPLVKMGVGIEVLFLIFATISYIAFFKYFKLIGNVKLSKAPVVYLIFYLLPTIHVWTAFLGKEPLLLLLMVCLSEIVEKEKYSWRFAIILSLIFLIRPHVCLILLFVILVLKIMDDQVSKKVKRQIIFFSTLMISLLTVLFMIFFLKIKSFSLDGVFLYIEHFKNETFNKGGSAISIKNTNIFTRLLYLLYMPLPFLYKIKNILHWIVAIENIYYLTIIPVLLYNLFNKKMNFIKENKFSLLAGIALLLLFASYLYNLGLGNRMKIMFLPYLFYVIIKSSYPNATIREDR